MQTIRLENLGKKFILSHHNYHEEKMAKGFSPSFPVHLIRQKITNEFWALRGINMEIEQGKVIGIIGRNGAGKSTLLNILAGISTPTVGKIEVNGRISNLLTLGAGFQDELTGKENIYLNSSILGMTHIEVNKKYRSIIEFSELDGFLDYPLQAFSQGMRLRLGFSIAVHMDFDILLIDEIFSVGDVSFQKKCFDKIEEFRKQGKTMIIVTQALDVIERICEEAFLLENGEIAEKGHPQKVINRYLELLEEKKLPETFQRRYSKVKWWADKRFWDKKEGSKEVRIIDVFTYNSRGKKTDRFKPGEKVTVKVHFIVKKEIEEPHFGIAIFREDGVYCYGPNTSFDGQQIDRLNKGTGFFSIEYKSLLLMPGKYRFSAAIWDKDEVWAYDYHVGFYKFEIIGHNEGAQLLNLKYKCNSNYLWQKFKILHPEKIDTFFNLNYQPQDQVKSYDMEILSIELLDLSNNPKFIFNTGDDLKIRLRFNYFKEPQDHYMWLGLFRSDDVYCHGLSKKLKGEVVDLTYPNLPLLTGEYYLSVGIWKRNQKEPLLYQHRPIVFNISFLGEDHGTVYLEHSWKWKLP
jgi:ABC-type polysaccharide/polyol phosphate transport system ATPase subunit